MMRLFGSEMTRLASRRLLRWTFVLFCGAILLIGVLVFVNDSNGTFTERDVQDALMGLSLPLLMLGWLVGASAIGAEWGNRTVSALLTWEPRRTRVLVAKAAAACGTAALLVVALEIVFTAVMMPVAWAADPTFVPVDPSFESIDPFSWATYAATAGRITLVSVLAGAFGFALATIGKNTAAALGGGMAYLLIVESLVRNYLPESSKWLLSTNIIRVIEGGAPGGVEAYTTTGAASVLALYAVGLLLVALWFFRRREMA
ncbi:MAG TPA: hypothetical protein VEU29_02160 [Actinomycetota bacterium]|nr:hypothetical protein [Actinomycetota bacterium]